MKYKLVAFWLIVFGALFAFLQMCFEYHFYYIEQSQLFLFSEAYIRNKLLLPGGFSMLVAEFLVQFFIRPYVGALVTAVLLTGVGVCTAGIVKRIAPVSGLFILYVLPMLALLFMHFDFNYRVQGTVCYLMMMALLCGYMRIRNDLFRLVAGCVLVPVLFWLAGSITVLFAGMVCLFEGLRKTPKWYISLIGVAEVLLLGVGTVYFSLMGEYRWVFGPDLYYHYTLHPKEIIYYSWICLPLVFLVAFFIRNKNSLSGKKWRAGISCIAQLAMIAAVLWWGMPKYSDAKTLKLKKLDYFARTEQWDKTIEECKGKLTNFLYMCHLNMALANKGELSDKMFNFDQRGPQGLLVQWNKSENISCMLSDIYFTMGATASSQEMAFEGYVSAMEDGNPRMLKRLVQTNLIYGTYPVAEKYISILEKTYAYRDWAQSQRKYLYNDEVVESDPILGTRRRMLPDRNSLAMIKGLAGDLALFLEKGPANSAALQYLGAMYLLAKDLEGFKALVEKYYGTEFLPVLPVHFQEAVIVMSEKEPDYWKRFNVSETIVARFTDYKKQVLANRNNSAIAGLLNRSYGNTYWFYFMFK
ncbi:DUF6057 family protein [Parabacteroides merdae]|uniref:DUF6057 family protein n=1 Tax=Parabacteroides merdae TaxID=46503 RepID=UPI001B723E71|nr:DUF6057 family protein [Parabacteroides merdae]MBP9556606.1 hypothetical protein [Parabacteroides sp.]UBD60777.1 DUF6057 family protein [Parabacteroides merdae]